MKQQPPQDSKDNKEILDQERNELLLRLQGLLEGPMVILGFIWLVLLFIDLTQGLSSFLQTISTLIWIIFILDFSLKLILAPAKLAFMKHNVLTLISLLVPALRVFRLARAFRLMRSLRAARGFRLVKVVGSLNRGLRALGASMSRRGFGYVLASTVLVTLLGSVGMYAFENEPANGLQHYSEALWWTVMLLTSLGSEYWPRTAEGRILCFLLALYGLAVFGYFTATLATYFMGRDAENAEAEIAGTRQVENLHQEIAALRKEVRDLLRQQRPDQSGPQP
jgi:voltage-gated potassium channel